MLCRRFKTTQLGVDPLEPRFVPSSFAEIESNNTVATANTVIVPTFNVLTASPTDWLTIDAAIGSLADRDYFRFTLNQAATLFLDVDSRDTHLSTTLDSVLDVYDSTGQQLIASNNQGYDFDGFVPPTAPVSSAASPDPALALELAPGTYLARMTSFLNATSGTYKLRLLADSTTGIPANSSRPGAAVTLFLDFNGHVGNDDWGLYTANSFDLTGQTSVTSAAERMAIDEMWRIVAEDFAPFDVNVTTIDPGSPAIGNVYQLVLTTSSPSIIGQSGLPRGMAIPVSFTSPATDTGFVFVNSFGDYLGGISGRMVAAAIEMANESSRQFGVAVGLHNYGGLNSQPIGIMQSPDSGLSRATWSAGLTHSGEFPVVSQNDVAALAAGGVPLRPDDHGDTLATATVMAGSTITGFIGDALNDKDVFQFPAMQGDYTVNVDVDPWAGNADLQLRVFNSAGLFLIASDPPDSFGLSLTFYVPSPSNYYFEVRSHGQPGAIGSYQLDYINNPVTEPARLTAFIVNGGANQRSKVTSLDLRFSRPVVFPNGTASAFQLNGSGGAVALDTDLAGSTPSQTLVHIRFPNGLGGFESLADGKYTFKLSAVDILDDGGNQFDGNGDGQPGGDYTAQLYRLYGDLNGDQVVDSADFALFRSVFGAAGSAGLAFAADADNDGQVGANDFAAFRLRFGQVIP